jgi:7,8-dihydropterin-6-yl-methyl-4-(beta-D-ribofuranosyl)aminobenzene 5'-phosphate synthase
MRIMDRRRFLKLGAVSTGLFAVGGARGLARGLGVEHASSTPEVDRLVMTNVVDNVYDIFARGGKRAGLTVQRSPLALGASVPLVAEHGLAFHLDSFRGSERRQILLDFSFTDEVLLQNYRALGVDPAQADALILSHGHVDHYGGLLDMALAENGRLEPDLTLYAGGEDTFCRRVVVTPAGDRIDWGQLDRNELEERGFRIALAEQPTVVAGHAFTSGQIPRRTEFEKGLPGARLDVGPSDSGCAASMHFAPTELKVESGEDGLVVDTFRGEIATAYNVKERGLVVISSCGHAGIVNTVRHVQAATGIEKIHAIAGGFHLAPAPDEVVARTVEEFRRIDPDYILPMHCTGMNTILALSREMPQKLVLPSTGTRVTFGA